MPRHISSSSFMTTACHSAQTFEDGVGLSNEIVKPHLFAHMPTQTPSIKGSAAGKGRRRASLVTVNEDPAILLTPPGRELLARLAAEPAAGSLAVAERLRREYPADLVATAMAQRELRLGAEAKFSRAAQMLFTRAGYEQSSSEAVTRYRASRLGDASRIADLCCGIGGDLIALAAASPGVTEVLAVDRDETHARLALHNAAVYGRAE